MADEGAPPPPPPPEAPSENQSTVVVDTGSGQQVVIVQGGAEAAPASPITNVQAESDYKQHEDECTTCDHAIAKSEADLLRLQTKTDPPQDFDYFCGANVIKEYTIGQRCGIAVMQLFVNTRFWVNLFVAGSFLMMFNIMGNLFGNGHEQMKSPNAVSHLSLGNLVLSEVCTNTTDNGYRCADGNDGSLYTSKEKQNMFEAQMFFFWCFFNALLAQLSYEGRYNDEIAQQIDDNTTTASDYCIMLYDLPPECTAEDIKACFKDPITCEHAYKAIPHMGVPEKQAFLVDKMVCACFDVKDLVENFKEKRHTEIIRNQVQAQIGAHGESSGRTSLLNKMEALLTDQATKYAAAVKNYETTKNSAKCTGVGFVVFQYTEHRDQAIDFFVPGFWTWLLRTFCCCCVTVPPRICGYQLGSWRAIIPCFRKILVKRAPEPSEIYWQNFGITHNQRSKLVCKNTTIIFCLIVFCGAIIFGLEAAKQATKDEPAGNQVLAIIVAIVVSVLNEVLRIVIVMYVDKELHETATDRTESLIQKLGVAYIVNTCAIPMLLLMPKESTQRNDGKDWWEGDGIATAGVLLCVSNAFVPSLAKYFGPDRWLLTRAAAAASTTQKEINEAYKPPMFDMAECYGDFIKTFALGLFFAPFCPITIPLTLVAFSLQYISNKAMLTKVCQNPPAMAGHYQRYVRHFLRGVLFVFLFVVEEIYMRACDGLDVCDENNPMHSKKDCVCKAHAGIYFILFLISFCVWTLLPCRDVFCRCFPACVSCCIKSCRRGQQVVPEETLSAQQKEPETGFPMTREDRLRKERFDGPGSWTYELPSPWSLEPDVYDRPSSLPSSPEPPEPPEPPADAPSPA